MNDATTIDRAAAFDQVHYQRALKLLQDTPAELSNADIAALAAVSTSLASSARDARDLARVMTRPAALATATATPPAAPVPMGPLELGQVIVKTIKRALAPRDLRSKAIEDRCDLLEREVQALRGRLDDLEVGR